MILFPAPYFYPILGVNFLDHDASLEYQNNSRSRISVGPATDGSRRRY